MRTVDIVIAGLISPAAVAAIGLADLYAQIPLRTELGLGTGAIALSSQIRLVGPDLVATDHTGNGPLEVGGLNEVAIRILTDLSTYTRPSLRDM